MYDEHWGKMKTLYELRDPSDLVELAVPARFPQLEQQTLARYMAMSKELRRSAILDPSQSFRIEFKFDGENTTIEKDLPSSETVRGFAVLFRQFHAADERASFAAMNRLVLPKAPREIADELKRWGRAVRSLKRRFMDTDAMNYFAAREGGERREADSPTPEAVIKAYFYGQHIHWGDGAEALAEWEEDEVLDTHFQMRFLNAMNPLAQLYTRASGFVSLVDGTAWRKQTPLRISR